MAGWVTKLVGGRLKTWRRRFLVLDRHGTLSMYSSKKDASQGKKPTDVLIASNVRSVVKRQRAEGGPWPPGTSVDVCIQVNVLKGRPHSVVCDSKAECVEWLRKLSPFAGNPRAALASTSGSDDVVSDTASHCSRRDSLNHAVQSPPKPSATSWSTTRQCTSDPCSYGLHGYSSIPPADRECYLKWLKVAELTLRRFEKICRLPQCSMSLECNMEWMYHHTPLDDQPRLGEFIFGDYPDELLHNLAPLLEHPVGRALLLSQMPASKISIVYETNQIKHQPPHDVRQHKGSLVLSIDPRRLGKEMTSVGLSFLDSSRVSRSQLIRSEYCGNVVFVNYLAAVDILNREQHFAAKCAELKRTACWPQEEKIRVSCLWYDIEAAVLSHPGGGFAKARMLGHIVFDGVIGPVLEQLLDLCSRDESWQTSTSLYYKLSRKGIVVEVNRPRSPTLPDTDQPIKFQDGYLYLRPTAGQLAHSTFDEVVSSFDLGSMVTHNETIV